jgi:hypothetical protein
LATFLEVITKLAEGERKAVIYLGDPHFKREQQLVRISPAAEQGYTPRVEEILFFMHRGDELHRIYDLSQEDVFAPGGEQYLTDVLGMTTEFVEVFVDPQGYPEPVVLNDTRRVFHPTSFRNYS